jgi:hypothetical protein
MSIVFTFDFIACHFQYFGLANTDINPFIAMSCGTNVQTWLKKYKEKV